MVYPGTFHRLVLIGTNYADTWNTTLSIVPIGGGTSVPAVSNDLLEDVGIAVGDWFNNTDAVPTGIAICDKAKLTSIKLNRVGPDGKYVDPETQEHVYSSPIAGAASGFTPAPQLTLAATLRGVNERARAGRGRMYFPPSVFVTRLQTDGRLSAADALLYAKGVDYLIGMINDVYLAAGVTAVAGIASKQGAGAFQAVNKVTAGRVVDTIRSRRSALVEDPQEAP